MSHYDFTRMGWQQFEHMVQSLAQAELGNGLTFYGSGPDGQREATWNGKVPFPIGREPWEGRGVLQAKFLERPSSTSESAWFLSAIRSELNGWVRKSKQRLRADMPSHYIFASNASLSGVAGVGGKDLFEATIEEFRPLLNIKDAVAWDYIQLRTMLDRHETIRKSYLEFILPGDFLAALMERLPPTVAVTAERLATNAATELTRRRHTKIGDAGYGDNAKLKLSEIGIDLPAQTEEQLDLYTRDLADVDVGAYVIGAADRVHRPSPSGDGASGVLIVGGPGQGKSTIAQLIAHTYRTRFLEEAGAGSFGTIADTAIDEIRTRLQSAGFPRPQRRRWPVVVDLAVFAQQTADAVATNLLAYIAAAVNIDGDAIRPGDLLEWLTSWPVILILDGFDEVANADDRERVVSALHELVVQARRRDIDLFVVVTTRPQGYHREMDEALTLQVLHLRELNDTEALAYAEALMMARAPEDPDERARVAERLLEAVADKVVGRLMSSPLQVTIMTALAERAVALPHTRHKLFNEYYGVIYDRERAKKESEVLLSRHRSHIDHLHERAGIDLAIASEKIHSADATFRRRDIDAILARRLRSAGFESYEVREISDGIMRAVTDRLVLLVAPTAQDRFGFEVRSLQEYMAARALVAGDDDEVREALKVILPSAHWRNTYLLALGRLIDERPKLGLEILASLDDVDRVDDESAVLLTGAQVAADLYLDGVASEYPVARRALLVCAARLLGDTSDTPSPQIDELVRLLSLPSAKPAERKIIEDALRDHASTTRASVAAKLLGQAWGLKHPLFRIRRSLASSDFKYERPQQRSHDDRLFALRERVAWITGVEAPPLLATEPVRAERDVDTSDQPGSLSNAGRSLASRIEEPAVVAALVAIAKQGALRDPDLAYQAALLLRSAEARREVGKNLRQDTRH